MSFLISHIFTRALNSKYFSARLAASSRWPCFTTINYFEALRIKFDSIRFMKDYLMAWSMLLCLSRTASSRQLFFYPLLELWQSGSNSRPKWNRKDRQAVETRLLANFHPLKKSIVTWNLKLREKTWQCFSKLQKTFPTCNSNGSFDGKIVLAKQQRAQTLWSRRSSPRLILATKAVSNDIGDL